MAAAPFDHVINCIVELAVLDEVVEHLLDGSGLVNDVEGSLLLCNGHMNKIIDYLGSKAIIIRSIVSLFVHSSVVTINDTLHHGEIVLIFLF